MLEIPHVRNAATSIPAAADPSSVAWDILELIAAAELALRYMDHPDVQAIGFSLPAATVADRLRAAIAKATAL